MSPVTGPIRFSLSREGFARLVRGEVIELRPDVLVALDDIGFPAMLVEIKEAWKKLLEERAGA